MKQRQPTTFFDGQPEGYVKAPEGTIFARNGYKFYIKTASADWQIAKLNVFKTPALTNDVNGKVWYKTTENKFSTGWVLISDFFTTDKPYVSVNDILMLDADSDFLLLNYDGEFLIVS